MKAIGQTTHPMHRVILLHVTKLHVCQRALLVKTPLGNPLISNQIDLAEYQ